MCVGDDLGGHPSTGTVTTQIAAADDENVLR